MDIENPILRGKNMYSSEYEQVDDSILGECKYCNDLIFFGQDYKVMMPYILCDNICEKLFKSELKEKEN